MKLIEIFNRTPIRTIVFIFTVSIVYSYFRGFEASMFVFLACMGVLGVKSLIAHEKGSENDCLNG